MATYFARKTGNINAADVWATTPSGTAAAVTFASGDVLMANSFTITINVSVDLGGTGQIRNDATGGATAGGSFTMSDGVTLTANVYGGTTSVATLTANPTASQFIVGNLYGGAGGSASAHAITNTINTGTLTITGNLIGGAGLSAGTCALNMSSANVVVSGNVTGASNTSFGVGEGIRMIGAGSCTITGNVTGGAHSTNYGVRVTGAGNITVVGQAIGGVAAPAINNESTGQVTVTRAVGNGFGGGSVGLSAAVGVSNVANQSSITIAEQIEFGTLGQSPVNGRIRLKKANTNVAVFNFCDTAGAKTLIDATANAAMPAAINVRSGVSYAGGAATGTCAVPAAGSVALGVAVDAGYGTAVLTPEAVWGHASRTLTAGAGISASDVWDYATRSLTTSSGPTAVQIRQEMDSNSTKLANLDASVSSRLASASYTAPANSDISAIKSKTDNLPASPAAVSDIPTTAQISAAVEGSLLNENDGQAVLNALVGAIGNQNVDEIALVAAIRSDLERSGGKLDSIPTAAAPSAASVASAVWSASTKEITGGVVDTLTNSPDVPTEAEIATAVWGASTKEITGGTVTNLTNAPASVTPADIWDYNNRTLTSASGPTAVEIRQEIDANSSKLDVAISSRLADADYVEPANSDVAAIKAKTDALPSDPADQSLLEAAIAGVTAPSAATVASAVRSELSVELARVDQAVSTRLAGSAYTAPANSDVAAIKVKTDALVVERLNNCATTAIVGNLLAQANS